MDDGTPDKPVIPTVSIKSRHDDGPTSSKPFSEFNLDDLIGRTFLLPPGDNGERLRAKVARKMPSKGLMVKESEKARLRKSSPIAS